MDAKLFSQAIVKFLSGLLIVGLLLFLPAGTFAYWQAWLLIGILFIPMFIAGLVMMKKSPDLLRKRLDAREEQAEQKAVIALSGLMFLAAFIVAGLNFPPGFPMQRRFYSCLPMHCMRRSCVRMSGSPGRLKCRRTRRLSTPDFTVLSDTRCTCVHFCCFFQCRWF